MAHRVEGRLKQMITIGQLAGYAGVTVKAVRHYHRRGLLAEPPRDASGYRRYSADYALALVKIKTLAEVGVPLARIKDLLTAETEQFAAAITEIDRALKERAASILRTRERIAQLRAGDRLFVSSEVADYLEQLHRLGVSQRGIDGERDGWILAQAISPLHAVAWIHDKRDAIADPEFQTLYLQYDDAFGWPPDDPRLEGLANRAHNWSTNRHSTGTSANVSAIDPAIANLVSCRQSLWAVGCGTLSYASCPLGIAGRGP